MVENSLDHYETCARASLMKAEARKATFEGGEVICQKGKVPFNLQQVLKGKALAQIYVDNPNLGQQLQQPMQVPAPAGRTSLSPRLAAYGQNMPTSLFIHALANPV